MSPKVKKRFPTLNHFVDAGLLTKEEKKIFEDLDNEYPNYTKNWQVLGVLGEKIVQFPLYIAI